MPKGMSLHIGLNSVDANHYNGWSGPLSACEADADDMESLAKKQGFSAVKLLTKQGTRANMLAETKKAAGKLTAGDIFLLTYSGHGGQVDDINGDEPDDKDETWCLYDGEFIDDELNAALAAFAAGVRILVLSDSCHSGTVSKQVHFAASAGSATTNPFAGTRAMPPDIADRVYRAHKAFYDGLQGKTTAATASLKATVLLISGCQDNQLSSDGDANGLFTATLLRIWRDGKFKGGYRKFHKSIVNRMPPYQSPNYFLDGTANPSFEAQKPFTV